mmetsp:Transcript_41249/g.82652  ORF Transcript_41249/g.82652 Transcript_41249/m.82652 type:complete len:229 (+) Transcript_41249:531-1217(+)
MLHHVQRHASQIGGRLQPIFGRAPEAIRDGNIARLVKAAAVEGRVARAAVDWLLFAQQFANGCVAVGEGGTLCARVHGHGEAGGRMAMEVERREAMVAHRATGDRVQPHAIDYRASWHALGALGHIVFPRRADEQCRASPLTEVEGRVIRCIVWLHPEAVLMVENEGLVGPGDGLVSIKEAPHMVTRPLASAVVSDVASGVALLGERRRWQVSTLVRTESDGARAHVS